MLSPFLVAFVYGFCSCMLCGYLQLRQNICTGACLCTAEAMDGKGKSCKDLVFKMIWLIFAWTEECS